MLSINRWVTSNVSEARLLTGASSSLRLEARRLDPPVPLQVKRNGRFFWILIRSIRCHLGVGGPALPVNCFSPLWSLKWLFVAKATLKTRLIDWLIDWLTDLKVFLPLTCTTACILGSFRAVTFCHIGHSNRSSLLTNAANLKIHLLTGYCLLYLRACREKRNVSTVVQSALIHCHTVPPRHSIARPRRRPCERNSRYKKYGRSGAVVFISSSRTCFGSSIN